MVDTGEAVPLIPAFDVGPTRYVDLWWYVPSGGSEYVVAEPDRAAKFAAISERSVRVEALAARYVTPGDAEVPR